MSNQTSGKSVKLQCWVKVRGFEPDGEEETFYIVEDREVDLMENRIAQSNPLAQVLLGSRVGDKVIYEPPGGRVELTIVDVGPL